MGQPVKLSDDLICDARATAELSQRSIAGQIEFWAQLGRSLEPLLRGDRALALRQAGGIRPLSEAIADVDTPAGKRRVYEYLQSRPFPHFEPVGGKSGLLRKIDEDGTETIGRFVNRVFEPVSD
jgi:ParD-like antitoxin of type II bacterial toxin-antitoxin system